MCACEILGPLPISFTSYIVPGKSPLDDNARIKRWYILLYGLPSSGTRPSRVRTGIPGHSPGNKRKEKGVSTFVRIKAIDSSCLSNKNHKICCQIYQRSLSKKIFFILYIFSDVYKNHKNKKQRHQLCQHLH